MNPVKKFPNVFEDRFGKRKTLMTKSLLPGKTFFEEKTVKEKGVEYREWDPTRSKLAAAIVKGVSQIGIKEGSVILYLGASHGYTPSYVSDMVGKDGFVFALDFAPVVARDLVFLCEARSNMAPILADANHPESYKNEVCGVDIVYQDIAQRDQVGIFLKNCDTFLKQGGFGILAVKARSVDVTKRPKEVFNQVRAELEKSITVADYRELDPFEKDHAFFVCKKH